MRFFLRPLLLYVCALWLLSRLFPFLHFLNEHTLLMTALALFMLNVVLKPFIKVLLLPINIITLGLFSWIIHVVVIFLATLAVPGFSLTAASFPAVQIGHYLIPPIHLSLLTTYVFFSLMVTLSVGLFDWVMTRNR